MGTRYSTMLLVGGVVLLAGLIASSNKLKAQALRQAADALDPAPAVSTSRTTTGPVSLAATNSATTTTSTVERMSALGYSFFMTKDSAGYPQRFVMVEPDGVTTTFIPTWGEGDLLIGMRVIYSDGEIKVFSHQDIEKVRRRAQKTPPMIWDVEVPKRLAAEKARNARKRTAKTKVARPAEHSLPSTSAFEKARKKVAEIRAKRRP